MSEQYHTYRVSYYSRWNWSEIGSYGVQRVRARNAKEAKEALRKLLDSRVVIEEVKVRKVYNNVQL